ncbi:MAG: hypothetical protein JSS09_00685, partial [Verrucomicrobia bacterium]|nr:hypothetical protein [Verrucomicrobiota bacterium]
FTFPGVIHCDAGLQGHWMVGCSNAKQFSSVVMRTQEDKIVNMHFSLTTPIIQNNIVISIYGRD